MNLAAVCAYCAEDKLKDTDPPEHAIPHAIGASFMVGTVCKDCNTWASPEIDQPFLDDDFVQLLRHEHRIPDPRRGTLVPNPLFRGFTETGAFAWMDGDGQPHARGQIIDLGDGTFQVRATSEEEAKKLARRVQRRAEANGQSFEIGEFRHTEEQIEITGHSKASTAVWPRLAAKIALATCSHVFDPTWRKTAEADDLRRVLRDEPSELFGEKPSLFPKKIAEPLSFLVEPPNHALIFTRGSGSTVLVIVLFGEYVMAVPVAPLSYGVPRTAWLLDPMRPKANGETTFDDLMMVYIQRSEAQGR